MEGIGKGRFLGMLQSNPKKKLIILGLSIILVVSLCVFAYVQFFSTPTVTSLVRVETVKRGDVTESVTASGTVQASNRVSLSRTDDTQETIATINVKVGDHVKAGQVVATLDGSSAKMEVLDAEANLLSAKAKLSEAQKRKTAAEMRALQANVKQAKIALETAKKSFDTLKSRNDIAKAKSNLDSAQRTYNSQKSLYAAGAISKTDWDDAQKTLEQAKIDYDNAVLESSQTKGQSESELEKAQAAYETAVSDLNEAMEGPDATTIQSARAQVEQAQAQLEKQKVGLNDLILKAPIDGVVVQINGSVGELPSNPFIVIDNSNSGKMEVLAQVSESDIGRVKKGLTATLTSNTYSDKTFTGVVTLVYPEATTDSGVTTYDVLLSVDNKESLLMTGMTMNVTIEIGTHKNVLYVPSAALKTQGGKDGVYLKSDKSASDSNRPNAGRTFQPVTIGYFNADIVEITEGLSEGDQVLITTARSSSSSSSSKDNGPGGMGGIPGMGGMGGGPSGGGSSRRN